MSDDAKPDYPEAPEGKASGLSDQPQVEFSRVDEVPNPQAKSDAKDEKGGASDKSTPRRPRNEPADAFDGFVPNIPATTTFGGEDADSRSGNYILSLGLGGSGKSTFHSFLLRYMEQAGTVNAQLKIPRLRSGGEDNQTLNLINQWRATWSRGAFVPATAAIEAAIREFKYKVVPTTGMKTQLEFGMLEVSGELLKQVQGGRTGKQTLPDAVHNLVANPSVNLVVLMLVHPDTPDNDLLLTNFLDYVDKKFPNRRNNLSLGVIIANPDKALQQLITQTGGIDHSPYSHYEKLEDTAIIDYMKAMSPGIMAKWAAWPEKNRMLVPLRLGEIEMIPDPRREGEMMPRLRSHDFEHVEKIFDWLFRKFTGKRRGLTWFQHYFGE